MNTKIKILVLIFIIIAVGIIAFKYLQNRPYKLQEGDIQLNQPTSNNNASLMEAFQKRRSSRAFSSVPLTEETKAKFWFVTAFTTLDFPTFVRPKNPICILSELGVEFKLISKLYNDFTKLLPLFPL